MYLMSDEHDRLVLKCLDDVLVEDVGSYVRVDRTQWIVQEIDVPSQQKNSDNY